MASARVTRLPTPTGMRCSPAIAFPHQTPTPAPRLTLPDREEQVSDAPGLSHADARETSV
jgi:hypothetical protein